MRCQKEDQKYDFFGINKDKVFIFNFVSSVYKRKIQYFSIVIITLP